MTQPDDLKSIGHCKRCGIDTCHSDNEPTNESSNVGDYDWICYHCQFKLMEMGDWKFWTSKPPT